MAKRKDSVALFEVITATKRRQDAAAERSGSQKPAASVLGTPKWWWKGKSKNAADANDPTLRAGDPTYAPALPAPAAAVEREPAYVPATAAPAVVQRVAPPAPERVTIPAERGESSSSSHGGPFGLDYPADHAPDRPRRSWLGALATFTGGLGGAKKVNVDPDRREITFRFRYTTAIIAGFAICVAVGLAYISGRSSNQASAGPNSVSSEQVRRGPILPGVLDVHAARNSSPSVEGADFDAPAGADTGRPSRGGSAARQQPLPPPVPQVARPKLAPPAAPQTGGVEASAKRVIGLNYVIVQSYPNRKDAVAAKEALDAAGIPVTIENPTPKGAGLQPDWHAVVGIHGFPRPNSQPEYKAYLAKVEAVSKQFAGTSKFKRFDPLGYKWR